VSTPEEELQRLRRAISTVSEGLVKRRDDAIRLCQRFETAGAIAHTEGEEEAYANALSLLHIWTHGEFGVPALRRDGGADNAAVTA
jgi:hypothetical protein